MTGKKIRIMTEKPLNAETPVESLRTWTTDNKVFFKRNQGQFADSPVALSDWTLSLDGLVQNELTSDLRGHPPFAEGRIGRHIGVLRQRPVPAQGQSLR